MIPNALWIFGVDLSGTYRVDVGKWIDGVVGRGAIRVGAGVNGSYLGMELLGAAGWVLGGG